MSKQRVQSIFREIFEDDALEIFPEMTARDVERWDSFNHINLIIALEEAFDLRFASDEISKMANVGDLFKVLQAHGKDLSW